MGFGYWTELATPKLSLSGIGVAKMDTLVLGVVCVSAAALDVGRSLLSLHTTVLALGDRTAFLGDKDKRSVLDSVSKAPITRGRRAQAAETDLSGYTR